MILWTSRHLITAALLLALTTSAAAIDCTIVEGYIPYCVENDKRPGVLPPSYWDHAFDGVIVEKQVGSKEEMAKVCPSFGEMSPHMLGCSYHYTRAGVNHCVMYLATDQWIKYNRVSIGAVRRHEIGHCNGWPGDHPTTNPPMPLSREEAPPPMEVKKPSIIDRLWPR
jgi:hypothetical protein